LTAEPTAEGDSSLARLRQSLQALALPAELQLHLLPAFVPELDELALSFEHWLRLAAADPDFRPSPAQRTALDEVERILDGMSGQANAHLWTRAGRCDGEAWSRLRASARAALETFGWPQGAPPGRPFEYIAW